MLMAGLSLPLLAGLWPSARLAYAAAPPKMTVQAGFDGYYKQVSWLPIQINLSLNEGSPDFQGWVEASYSNFDQGSTTYRRSVELVAPANRTVWLYLPSDPRSILEVQVRLTDQKGTILDNQDLPIRPVTQNEVLLGVISDNPSAANYLNGERLTQPYNLGSALFNYSNSYSNSRKNTSPPRPTIRVAHLNTTSLPPDGSGWDSLDGLIVTDLSNTNLSDQFLNQQSLYQATSSWLAQGRLLFVAGDNSLRRAGFLTELLAVKPGGQPQSVPFPDALRQFINGDQPPPQVLLAQTTPAPGALTPVAQGNQPLMVRRSFGLGISWFLATELKALPDSLGLELWRYALNTYEPRISYGQEHRQAVDSWRWPGEINPNSKVSALPDIWLIALVLVIYAFLLGPVSYAFLKKTGKRELGWVIAPALAILFGLGIYLTGLVTGGDPLVISRASIITLGQTTEGKFAGGSVGLATIYSNSRVDFRLNATEQAFSIPLSRLRSGAYIRGGSATLQNSPDTVQQGTGGGYGQVLMGLNDLRSYLVEEDQSQGVGAGILANLQTKGNDLSGTVENRTGSDWLDLAIWKPGGQIYRIPQLKAGEKITLKPEMVLAKNGGLAHTLSGNELALQGGPLNSLQNGQETYLRHKEAILSTVLGFDGEALPKDADRVYLVGWKKATDNFGLQIENRKATSVDLTLLFEPLALQ